SGTTVATMVMGALALALAALMSAGAPVAGLASIAWTGAWSVLGVLVARRLGPIAADQQATWAAGGAMASAFSLWRLAGAMRGAARTDKGLMMPEDAPADLLRRGFAPVVEGVASAAGLLASALVLMIGLRAGVSATWVTFGGVGVLFAAALLHIAL